MAHGGGGLGSLGREFLASISGSVVHCVKYGSGKNGKIVCRKYAKGGGKPNSRARKQAGVKRKYRWPKISGHKRPVRKGSFRGAKKHCVRYGKGKSGRKVCRVWGPTRKMLRSGRMKGRSKGKVCYMRKMPNGKRKRICRSVGKRSGSMKGKSKGKRKSKKKSQRRLAANAGPNAPY
jgi:hypothetical protein